MSGASRRRRQFARVRRPPREHSRPRWLNPIAALPVARARARPSSLAALGASRRACCRVPGGLAAPRAGTPRASWRPSGLGSRHAMRGRRASVHPTVLGEVPHPPVRVWRRFAWNGLAPRRAPRPRPAVLDDRWQPLCAKRRKVKAGASRVGARRGASGSASPSPHSPPPLTPLQRA